MDSALPNFTSSNFLVSSLDIDISLFSPRWVFMSSSVVSRRGLVS